MRYRRDLHSGLLGHSGREYMNPLRTWFVLLALILGFAETGPRAQAQNEKPAGEGAQAASATASKAEVEELPNELAAQRRTIERLYPRQFLNECLQSLNRQPLRSQFLAQLFHFS